MIPCPNCENRGLAAAGAAVVAAKFIPGAVASIGNAINTQQDLKWSEPSCGKRPFFIGKRRNEWDECVSYANAMRPQTQQNLFPGSSPVNQTKSFISKNKTPIIIGASLLGLLIITKIAK